MPRPSRCARRTRAYWSTLTILHLLAAGHSGPACRRHQGGPVFDEDFGPAGGPGLDEDYQLDEHPQLTNHFGDVAKVAVECWLSLYANNNALLAEATRRKMLVWRASIA